MKSDKVMYWIVLCLCVYIHWTFYFFINEILSDYEPEKSIRVEVLFERQALYYSLHAPISSITE